ncbi:hypothetical protein HD554DRAFT_1656256 [Boletus coccyginus]|nr:hypothetical protein HD554DRAFT_1656256 [Boletus coccyginus]
MGQQAQRSWTMDGSLLLVALTTSASSPTHANTSDRHNHDARRTIHRRSHEPPWLDNGTLVNQLQIIDAEWYSKHIQLEVTETNE